MKKFFQQFLLVERVETQQLDPESLVKLATATLLVEVARADFVVDDDEHDGMRRLLKQHFDLDDTEVDRLLQEANSDADRMVSLQHITRSLNEQCSHDEKRRIIELMWEVVYADGDKSHYEEHLIRQVAELLYLSHGEFIQARHKAEI